MYYHVFESKFGDIAILANDQGLTQLSFQQGKVPIELKAEYQHTPEKFTQVCKQLTEYFDGKRTQFDVKLAPAGTQFQKQVWQALQQIPYGKTSSYGELATSINNPKAVRAVGTANGANKIAIIIPCHRVIGANKSLTGYAGGLDLKAKLLTLEGADFTS
ncbi:methylated-DNA--[protein]-cysteine S-methyltransferase [Thalassotalea mangrovi]|uniref:Methylated-DNA--protein-cysteine methyltransferase n=1 Tax=Thalassotalea mangrovi TaxID=2572245 RepID=A0A4U1B4F3_9GAMM|nr:methylated-DNA--[protein]-cysteine S-methyltransferase [Thalassotalea mangrovi]TKB45114.1 methylated-DNA--[protein]-cysteine S-methyltransferase [Thalassotalea mangrovi]